MYLAVSVYMEYIKEKNFVMVISWWRVEADANLAVNKIPEIFHSMGFGVEVSKLHFWPCIHHVKCFTKVIRMKNGDKDVKTTGLGWYYIFQDSLYFSWLYSYKFDGGLMG